MSENRDACANPLADPPLNALCDARFCGLCQPLGRMDLSARTGIWGVGWTEHDAVHAGSRS